MSKELHDNLKTLTEKVIPKGDENNIKKKRSHRTLGWGMSIGLHLLLALAFYYLVFASKEEDSLLPPLRVMTMHPTAVKEHKNEVERTIANNVEIAVSPEADIANPILNFNISIDENTISDDMIKEQDYKDVEVTTVDSESGLTGAFMAISGLGSTGNSVGMFGNRSGSAKRRALIKHGGNSASESAVDAALRWFKRHQSPDGSWDVQNYPNNCSENSKCEPAPVTGDVHTNNAMTGYAVLCYLGAGYDHKSPSKYQLAIKNGLKYIVSTQINIDDIRNNNYVLAVTTMALCEAYAMTNDSALKGPAQIGLNLIMNRQTKETANDSYRRLGWDYYIGNRNDASISGWCVMALKSGLGAGLNVGNSMIGASNYIKRAWQAANPNYKNLKNPYNDTSNFPYNWNAETNEVDLRMSGDLAPVGALCAMFLGLHNGNIMFETMCNYIMKQQFPVKYPTNTYYMYYSTLTLFQAGGERWNKWNNTVRDLLVNAQRKDEGCYNGSWDWERTEFLGHEYGRILSTAYCCLSLEVYYRYKKVGAKKVGK